MPEFDFLGQVYTDSVTFVSALAKNWEEGKSLLFEGDITAHFRIFNQEIADYCADAEAEADKMSGAENIIYWALLYKIHPALKGFYWNGQVYEDLTHLGREILDHLWEQDTSQNNYYLNILSERLLSHYFAIVAPENEALNKAAQAIENHYQYELTEKSDMRKVLFGMGYYLSGQKQFSLAKHKFKTIAELADYMQAQLDNSIDAFNDVCHKIVDYDGNLDSQLETWLVAIGKYKELDQWRSLISQDQIDADQVNSESMHTYDNNDIPVNDYLRRSFMKDEPTWQNFSMGESDYMLGNNTFKADLIYFRKLEAKFKQKQDRAREITKSRFNSITLDKYEGELDEMETQFTRQIDQAKKIIGIASERTLEVGDDLSGARKLAESMIEMIEQRAIEIIRNEGTSPADIEFFVEDFQKSTALVKEYD